jgi:alkenylglycerophosphocholine/alkenylglycerophosphoethanolamine hydrolase
VVVIGLVSLTNWVSAWQSRMMPYYITKPIVLSGLILFMVMRVPITPNRLPFLLGLVFSLLGDIFLIPKGTRWFLVGMGAFSITQLMYIWGFNISKVSLPIMIVGVVAFLGGVVLIHLVVKRFSDSSSVNKAILPFIKGYGALVLAMSISALLCLGRPEWSDLAAVMAGIGGILFFLSDGMIGLDKLDRRLPKYRFWIIFTYHLAQFLIVGAVIQLPGQSL